MWICTQKLGRILVMKQNVFKSTWCMKSSASVLFVCSDKDLVSMLAKSMVGGGFLLLSILANGCSMNSDAGPYNVATCLFHRM